MGCVLGEAGGAQGNLPTISHPPPRSLLPTPHCAPAPRFVMIQQQKAGRTLPAEFRHIMHTYGPMKTMKGLSATVVRESLYATGYLAVAPLLREVLAQQPAVRDLPGGPFVLSGVAAGLLATVCTQPADTVKTRLQVSALERQIPGFRTFCCRLPTAAIDAKTTTAPSPRSPRPAGVPRQRHPPPVPFATVHCFPHCAYRGGRHILLGPLAASLPRHLRRQVLLVTAGSGAGGACHGQRTDVPMYPLPTQA